MNPSVMEELEVLNSIYGSDVEIICEENILQQVTFCQNVNTVKFYIPTDYPSSSPVIEIIKLNKALNLVINSLREEIEQIFARNKGSETLFPAIEAFRDFLGARLMNGDEHWNLEVPSNEISVPTPTEKVTLMESPHNLSSSLDLKCIEIIHGSTFNEKKSSFQAHMAHVTSLEEVELFRNNLLNDKKIAAATHNILAYRFRSRDTGILHQDYDDDGETAAGGRLSELLRLMPAEDVAVIVTRNFGGILLGADRFKFINNAARELLESQGFGTDQSKKRGKKR